MAIKNITVFGFLGFTEEVNIDFSDGINVLIGDNGSGKTSILKMMYAATQWTNPKTNGNKWNHFFRTFSISMRDIDSLKNNEEKSGYAIKWDEYNFSFNLSNKTLDGGGNVNKIDIQSVYIPTTEMLSHTQGFWALDEKYYLPFDQTQVDIIRNASLPNAKNIAPSTQAVISKIEAAIDGKVIQEDDIFYVIKKDGKKLEFSLEAEGLRKLGLLWKLLMNGLLDKGSVLFWDEPEANLNPESFDLIAEILLALQKSGVQIFVATHSYNFAKYLEIRRKETDKVLFHNLYKEALDETESVIRHSSGNTIESLPDNRIMKADEDLLNEVYDLKGTV